MDCRVEIKASFERSWALIEGKEEGDGKMDARVVDRVVFSDRKEAFSEMSWESFSCRVLIDIEERSTKMGV